MSHTPLFRFLSNLICHVEHQVMSCHVMSCHVEHQVMSCHVMSCHVEHQVMSCHVMSCHVEHQVMSCHAEHIVCKFGKNWLSSFRDTSG